MATKTKKASSKKTPGKMRDLPTKKNPQGGAQKREGNGATSGMTDAGSPGGGRRRPF